MINANKLKEIGIDYEAGLKRFMYDTELYEAILNAFLCVDIREQARPAFEGRDNEKLLQAIHEAKGSSGNAGFTRLYEKSSALVSLLRSNNITDDELIKFYDCFEKEYTKIFDGIKAALQ